MKKATIKIEVIDDGERISGRTDASGEIGMIMLGLANAIKEVETEVLEENRDDYRVRILEMLNDRY